MKRECDRSSCSSHALRCLLLVIKFRSLEDFYFSQRIREGLMDFIIYILFFILMFILFFIFFAFCFFCLINHVRFVSNCNTCLVISNWAIMDEVVYFYP